MLLAFVAGTLSVLSPCVVPLLPVVVAGALERHRLGPLALAVGLAAGATAFGFLFALLGIVVARDVARGVAAALLVLFGAVLVSTRLDLAFARATAPLARGAAAVLARLGPRGLAGQVAIGALLGVVWTPCGGPALGSAVTLAAQRTSLPDAAGVMAAYSVGAAVPLLVLAYGARRAVAGGAVVGWIGRVGRPAMGVVLVVLGVLTLAGVDEAIEAVLVDHMPWWLVDLTTRF